MEIAIVLIIIGFIIAITLSTDRLMDSSMQKKAVTEMTEHQNNVLTFFDKFHALPGEYDEAEDVFGCASCNGDLDDQIDWANTPGPQAWLHLFLAGMINRDITSGAAGAAVIGVNVPAGGYVNSGYFLDDSIAAGGDSTTTYLGLGAQDGAGRNDGAIMNPNDAYAIDLKMDDGVADAGDLRGLAGCTAGYDLSSELDECAIIVAIVKQ